MYRLWSPNAVTSYVVSKFQIAFENICFPVHVAFSKGGGYTSTAATVNHPNF